MFNFILWNFILPRLKAVLGAVSVPAVTALLSAIETQFGIHLDPALKLWIIGLVTGLVVHQTPNTPVVHQNFNQPK